MRRSQAKNTERVAAQSGTALPPAPDRLSDGAKLVWAEVLGAVPADHFNAGDLLTVEIFCELTARARIALRVDEPKVYAKLAGQLVSLATKLRLTPSSRHTSERKHGKSVTPASKPGYWQGDAA